MSEYRNALPTGHPLQEYIMEAVLGQGGFGVTYLAQDTLLEQKVAIKEYLPTDAAVREGITVVARSSEDLEAYRWGLDRFLMEARTLARFRHKNIVRVQRFFEANGTAYAVMEYEDGDSLSSVLKDRGGFLPEDELKAVILPLLDGLRVIHAEGFIHRDIKPGNIFIRRDGSPVLIDFGSARDAMAGRELTAIATPGYAPFEQYFSDGNQGPWSDIYAMGGVVYRAVIGKAPPDAASRLKKDPMVPLVQAAQGRYSADFLAAIDWSLLMDEAKRPQNVDAWLAALQRSGAGGRAASSAGGSPDEATVLVGATGRDDAATIRMTPPHIEPEVEKTTVMRDAKATWGQSAAQQKPPGSSGKVAAIAAVALVVVLGGGYGLMGGKGGEAKALPQAAVPEASAPAPAKAAAIEVAELLALADADVAAGRLDAPKDGNAVDRYLKVLALSADNAAARTGLGRVADRYVDLAEQIAEKDLKKAKSYVDKAGAIRGEANIKEAREWLADLQRLHKSR